MAETQDIYQVICEMKENEILWNLRHPQFLNAEKKQEIIRKISQERGLSVQRIKDLIKYIKREFYKQERLHENKSGDGVKDKVLSKEWKWYKECTFLKTAKTVNKTTLETDVVFGTELSNEDQLQHSVQDALSLVEDARSLRLITPSPQEEYSPPSKRWTPAGYKTVASRNLSISRPLPVIPRTPSVSPPIPFYQSSPISPERKHRKPENRVLISQGTSMSPERLRYLTCNQTSSVPSHEILRKFESRMKVNQGTAISPERLRCPIYRDHDYRTESPAPTVLLPPEIVEQRQQTLIRSLLCSFECNLYEANPSAEELYSLHSDLIRFINGYFDMKRNNYLPAPES